MPTATAMMLIIKAIIISEWFNDGDEGNVKKNGRCESPVKLVCCEDDVALRDDGGDVDYDDVDDIDDDDGRHHHVCELISL